MRTLVIGGAASGKSAFAESLIVGLPGPRCYIATMEPYGEEGAERVRRHRMMRAEKGFVTLERYTDLAGLALPAGGAALLECLGNLAANELFSPAGAGDGALSAIIGGIEALARRCDDLVLVTNDIFRDAERYAEGTERYIALLAEVNRAASSLCDAVVEVVCGIPVYWKGEGV